MLGRQRMAELVGLSLVGSLVSILLSKVLKGVEGTSSSAEDVPFGAPVVMEEAAAISPADAWVVLSAAWERYWKYAIALGTMVGLEAFKELGQQGRSFRLSRVLLLSSFPHSRG